MVLRWPRKLKVNTCIPFDHRGQVRLREDSADVVRREAEVLARQREYIKVLQEQLSKVQ